MRRLAFKTAKYLLGGLSSLSQSYRGRSIYYHSVHPNTPRSHRPAQFRAQLRWLREHGYRDVLVRELPELLQRDALHRHISITFDDGYRDNFEYALPILKDEGFRATFFVVAGMVGSEPRSSDEGHMLYDRRPMMCEVELRAMVDAEMEIASHGWSHRQATQVLRREGFSGLVDELRRAKAQLEEVVSREVVSFAYPNGQLGARSLETARAVQLAGYRACASTLWGIIEGCHPLEINRCEMSSDDSLDEFAAKMRAGRDWRTLANRLMDRSGVWYE